MPKNTVHGGPSIAGEEVTEWDGTSSETSPEKPLTPSSEETTSNEEPAPETESLSDKDQTESGSVRTAVKKPTTKR